MLEGRLEHGGVVRKEFHGDGVEFCQRDVGWVKPLRDPTLHGTTTHFRHAKIAGADDILTVLTDRELLGRAKCRA
jgi:hypothetical protein